MRRTSFLLLGLLAAPTVAAAQATLADYDYEHLAFSAVGFDVGRIWPSKVESTTSYSLRLDLGFLGPGVRIMPSASYWSSTMQDEELARLASQINELPALADNGVTIDASDLAPIDWSNLSVNVDGHFVWGTPIPVFTYVGAGLGIHMLNGQGESIDDTFVEDLLDSITPSVAAMAGAEYRPTDRFRIFGEARYTLMTDLHYPGLRVGLMVTLPPRGSGDTAEPGDGPE